VPFVSRAHVLRLIYNHTLRSMTLLPGPGDRELVARVLANTRCRFCALAVWGALIGHVLSAVDRLTFHDWHPLERLMSIAGLAAALEQEESSGGSVQFELVVLPFSAPPTVSVCNGLLGGPGSGSVVDFFSRFATGDDGRHERECTSPSQDTPRAAHPRQLTVLRELASGVRSLGPSGALFTLREVSTRTIVFQVRNCNPELVPQPYELSEAARQRPQ